MSVYSNCDSLSFPSTAQTILKPTAALMNGFGLDLFFFGRFVVDVLKILPRIEATRPVK